MAEPYLGEIRMFAGNYAPQGWALCNGQLLNISQYEALYTLLGTTYGGDGQTTFALPDMQGRIPIHPNSNYNLGSKGGVETVTLTTDQIPSHTHTTYASTNLGNQPSPNAAIWAMTNEKVFSSVTGPTVPMSQQALTPEGGNQPHENMMPSLTISFIIATQGLFPTQA